MVIQTRLLVIDSDGKTYSFRIRIHRAEHPVEQMIEPTFYQEFEGTIHSGIHYEMELVESPVWERIDPEVPIHIHQNPDSKRYFVCFTGNITTLEAALAVLRTWCVGTVYALTRNQDFGHLVGDQFFSNLKEHFGITISKDLEVTS